LWVTTNYELRHSLKLEFEELITKKKYPLQLNTCINIKGWLKKRYVMLFIVYILKTTDKLGNCDKLLGYGPEIIHVFYKISMHFSGILI
jgi:hypothetical protein